MKSGRYLLQLVSRILFIRPFISIFIISIALVLLIAAAGNREKPALDAGTQTAPQGMVLIETDSLLPYYISITEESNLNWMTYIKWLETVFVTYPEVAKKARPQLTKEGNWLIYNDPILDNYFEHPGYQLYPVTGVTWHQVISYLEWKSDRLNEAILLKCQNMELDMLRIVDSDNFNTEAYLINQYYYPSVDKEKWPRLAGTKKGHRDPETRDGIFFPDYRLPTEQEWEAAYQYANNPDNLDVIQSSIKMSTFLKPWVDYFMLDKQTGSKSVSKKQSYTYSFDYGVSEWLINKEGVGRGYRQFDSDMLESNGWLPFEKFPFDYYDSYGEIREKDSLGRFGFQFVQVSNIQAPIFMTPPYSNIYVYQSVFSPNPFYKDTAYRDSVAEAWNKLVYNSQILFNPGLTYEQSPKVKVEYYDHLIRDSVIYSYKRELLFDHTKAKRQYIKSNYWQVQKGTGTLPSDTARQDLGFRCVLPYTGIQVEKKYKVRW